MFEPHAKGVLIVCSQLNSNNSNSIETDAFPMPVKDLLTLQVDHSVR